MEANVLLTYGWVRSSYAALRNLTKYGLKVTVSDSSSIGMSQLSRFKEGFEKYTSHYEDEEQFIEDLVSICKRKEIDLIFPSHNETEIIAKYRHRFPPKLTQLIPEEHHCSIFNNKSRAYELVNSLGIPVPKRLEYKDPLTLSKELESNNMHKTVIKLLTGNSAKGVFYSNSPLESQSIVLKLIEAYKLSPDRYPQIEEYVSGEGYGSSVLYWKGQLIANFTHKRLRDKIESGGTSTLREVAQHKGIETAAMKIFDHIGWNGLAMCEFKVCPRTHKFWFIEVNPRMWGSIPLSINAGVEFPALACMCVTKGPNAAIEHYKQTSKKLNWRARWILGDIFVAVRNLCRFQFTAFRSILSNRGIDSVDDFFWDDPWVFFGQILFYFKNTFSKMSFNPSEKGMLK